MVGPEADGQVRHLVDLRRPVLANRGKYGGIGHIDRGFAHLTTQA